MLEKELNEIEEGYLSYIEFKVMIIRMLSNMKKHIEAIKKRSS